jgi:hypothetical protein
MTNNPAIGGGTADPSGSVPFVDSVSGGGSAVAEQGVNGARSAHPSPPSGPTSEKNREGSFTSTALVGLSGGVGIIAGAVVVVSGLLNGLPESAQIGAVAVASLLLLPIVIAVLDLRESDIVDRGALTMAGAAAVLTVAGGWLWLLNAKTLGPTAPVGAPLVCTGGILLSFFLVARKTRGLAHI